jgi:predicted transcriptional regulator of viral defense system
MNERQFTNTIKEQNLGIITIPDTSRIINKNRKYTVLYLKRLEKRKIIKRIEKGKYALQDTPSFVIASNLVIPSYISFLSGLSYYNLTTQIPRITQIVTTKSKKRISYENEEIQFIKLKKVFGYDRIKTQFGHIFIGEKEKIIIDSLLLPKYCPINETINAIKESKLNTKKLTNHSLKMNSIIVIKRLGYILEHTNGIDIYPKVKKYLNKRYDLLNPQLPSTGENNTKWKLKINEVL